MNNPENISIGLVGPGNVGSSLAEALSARGLLRWAVARSEGSLANLSGRIAPDIPIYRDISRIPEPAPVIALSVADRAIPVADREIAARFGDRLREIYIFHCSGSLTAGELAECQRLGGRCASLHPYQTFWHSEAATLSGISWGVDCSEADFAHFRKIIRHLGGHAIKLGERTITRKTLYHASAVAASNFMTTIIQLAKEMADMAGINSAEFQPPIIETTAANNLESLADPDKFPLTGPVARGDIDTLRAHIESMAGHGEILGAYCHLSMATAGLALKNKLIDQKTYQKICELLESYLP
ncbi:MAG: Rossmann-like and DUF2520 domain-containing protein [Candidatus Kapaibacterium sp.]